MDPSDSLVEMRTPKILYQAKRFAIEEVEESLPDGSILTRNIVRHPGAVVVLPLIDADHICMIHTFRVAIQRWNLELPAGTLDKGLSPLETAELELQEETGYRAERISHVFDFAMSPGILDERMHFFVAEGLVSGVAAREPGEQIDNRVLSWSEVEKLLLKAEIIDAKSLVALLWFLRFRRTP